MSRTKFQQGPWNLGAWSVPMGIISSIFLFSTSICFFFPTSFDKNMRQTWDDFNYSIFVFSGALFIAATYWFLPKSWGGARHFFTGPVRPEDVQIDGNGEFKEQKFMKMRVNNNEHSSTVNPHVSEVNVRKTSPNEHESPDGP